jgi:hypothetical protein
LPTIAKKNIQTDLIIMDFAKAFDKVPNTVPGEHLMLLVLYWNIFQVQQLFVCGLTERLGSRVGCFLVYHNIGVSNILLFMIFNMASEYIDHAICNYYNSFRNLPTIAKKNIQTDLIIMDFAKAFDKVHIGDIGR